MLAIIEEREMEMLPSLEELQWVNPTCYKSENKQPEML